MRRFPSNSAETMVAYQCRPSPSSAMCSHGRPAAMMDCSSSAVISTPARPPKGRCAPSGGSDTRSDERGDHGGLSADLVADAQEVHGQGAHDEPGAADDAQAEPGRGVADAEE